MISRVAHRAFFRVRGKAYAAGLDTPPACLTLLAPMVCPWVTCTPGIPQGKIIESLAFAKEQFDRRGL